MKWGIAYSVSNYDITRIKKLDGMSNMRIIEVAEGWSVPKTFLFLTIVNITFFNGVPAAYQQKSFRGEHMEDFVESMAELSLTHRIMYIEDGAIIVTESTDGTTNIDADVIDAIASSFGGGGK